MTKLVFIENGKTVTDSLTVAEVFGKEHKNVLRDIENLECSPEFNRLNFERIEYLDARNRSKPKYIITQDGFSFLAMGYTGSEAARFKEQYIAAFNHMKERLNTPATKDPVKLLLQATQNLLAGQGLLVERVDDIEQKLDKQITLDSGQQRMLQQAINKKVYSTNPTKEERSELFRQLHREIKDRWQVPSYKDVLRQDLQDVLSYISAWKPIKKGVWANEIYQ